MKRQARGLAAALSLVSGVLAQGAAERVLAELSLEAKAGQLFMSWILTTKQGQEHKRAELARRVEEVGLGGVILSLGPAADAIDLIRDLQRRSAVPLLVASDFEAGVAFRLYGATRLGVNMLVGATGDEQLARECGRITAVEGRALGFHWAFAPVLDVNVNPRNPIINMRSYGEDPALVARLGASFVRGLEGAGMLAAAKHYPGHGDVATDSHLALPRVPGDRARLDRIELVPFRAAIAAGTSGIMTGHLSVPGLGEDPAVPATLSHRVLTDELRGRDGFDGIIVTDALDMDGLLEGITAEEAAVRALLAGADLLLMPPDPAAARDAIVAAVRSGRVSEQRLDESVLRLLRAKERLGLFDGAGLPRDDWREVITMPAHNAVAQEIARRGTTVVIDRDGVIPLSAPGHTVLMRVLDSSIDEGDRFGASDPVFLAALKGLGVDPEVFLLHPESSDAEVAAAVAAARAADLVIADLRFHVRSSVVSLDVPTNLRPALAAFEEVDRGIAVSFGNPYLVSEFPGVSAYVCTYGAGVWTELAVANLLVGNGDATGRLPITIPGVAAVGDGVTVLAPGPLVDGAPDERLTAELRGLLEFGVAEQAFPGAVALVARRGAVAAEVAVGRQTFAPDAAPITADVRFDLASLTKVCATAPVILRLVARGVLDLDQPVREVLPAFAGGDKDGVTLRHLLMHESGLPASAPFYRELAGREAVVAAVAATDLVAAPGARVIYSDLGMILAMACAEAASGTDFATLVAREVSEPLQLRSFAFAPTGSPIDAVPTEICEWRGRLVAGEAHDENAFAMGGVSGHAGLFGTARDVATVATAFAAGGRGWLPPGLARAAWRRPAGSIEGGRGLGWAIGEVPGLSAEAFGHTGFTGVGVWCDPRTDVVVVLLTNAVQVRRRGEAIREIRRRLTELVGG